MAGLVEINSFVGKFLSLWKAGRNASLQIVSAAGEATIKLEVGLGNAQHLQHQAPNRVPGPARLRRSERRQASRRVAEEAATGNKENVEILSEAEEASVDATDIDNIVRDAGEQAAKVENSIHDDAEEASKNYEFDVSDGDIYDFTYWDESKKCEAQDTLNVIEERLKRNFCRFNVEVHDQVYQFGAVKNATDREGFEVKLKVKKNSLKLEHAVRNVQTSGGPLRISIRQVHR